MGFFLCLSLSLVIPHVPCFLTYEINRTEFVINLNE